MIKDAVGNEIKVGDTILVGMQGMSAVKILSINEGGLTAVIPGTKTIMQLPGNLKIEYIQDIQFDSSKPLPFFKIEVPKDNTLAEREQKKEHGPN